MPIITFASSKGGAGRTTSAIILALTLARKSRVALIDADPNNGLTNWFGRTMPNIPLMVQTSKGEDHINSEVIGAGTKAYYVIVDLPAGPYERNALAIADSDLVIIPMGDDRPDADAAAETVKTVGLIAEQILRDIPAVVLFARTQERSAKSQFAQEINDHVRTNVECFRTELQNRAGFSALHDESISAAFYRFKPHGPSDLARAISNADLFTSEVLGLLAPPRFESGAQTGSVQMSNRRGWTR